ncbi:MAG: lytic transglycosylase domain-containing protein, partial [Acidimicrobiia bacterium]|nr:lytic transglycosylase domain-containing protein [Acidimicrobiia bacterium]
MLQLGAVRALRSTFALLMLAAGASACAVKPSAMNLPAAGPLVSDEASPPAPAVDGSDLVPIPLTLAELVDSPILPDTIGTDSLLDGGETPDGVLALAGGEDGDQAVVGIDIPLNNRVLAYVQSFTGRLRTHVQDALARGAQYLPMIKDVFRAEGLPLELAYIPIVESAFQPDAVSRALATGLWQFMGPTARENGLVHDWYMDERSEP